MKASYNITFITGAYALFDLALNEKRKYILEVPLEYNVHFDSGILHVRTEAGFVFDGRSGPKCIDWFAPNLGSLNERVAWHMHDALAYGQSLSFKDTNYALKYVLRDQAGYGFKAEIIRLAVSISDSWYGTPKPDDKFYYNLPLVSTEWRV